MLTLHKEQNKVVCEIVNKKKRTPVYWHPRINPALMNAVDDIQHFNDGFLRDNTELGKKQANLIFEDLEKEETPEENQHKFFKVKRVVQERLLTEMELDDGSNEIFQIDFPQNQEFCGHELVTGSTQSGKTYFVKEKILRNLKGPERFRRHFLIISSEWHRDNTLSELKEKKYENYVTGVDVSESSLKDSEHTTAEEFFENEIKLRVENVPKGTVLFFDDSQDSCCPDQLRQLINRMLRVARHSGVSLIVILHSIRSGAWSSQANNSVKYYTLFPRAQKNKIIAFVNQDLAVPLKEARETIRRFAQSGRSMTVHLHAPECLVGPKLLKLL